MECLHGKPASSSKTANGVFFYCGQKPSCNFFCSQNDCCYCESAISRWRKSNIRQPRCHGHEKLAKMQVVKDILKPSFGRPFLVCPNKENPCSFWQWGDEERPNCYHDLPCYIRKVKKDGKNKGRLFYTCSKGKDVTCNYFKWYEKKMDEFEDPFYAFSIPHCSSPPSYDYFLKENGEVFHIHHTDRKQAYADYLTIRNNEFL